MDFEQILKYFRLIIEDILVKYQCEANKYETVECLREYEKYKLAKDEIDTFYSHLNYPEEVLIAAGLEGDDLDAALEDSSQIPQYMRDTVLKLNRVYIISNFEGNGDYPLETNDYYRMLLGLPPISDTESDYFYCPSYISEFYGIDSDTPIHLLSITEKEILMDTGYINTILKDNPDKLYLKYITCNLDLIELHEAGNFELLRCTKALPDNLYEGFINSYEACRDFTLTVYYVKEFSNAYKMYDNFISLIITMMALFRILVKLFNNVVTRNFFDIRSVISFFEAYSVPYAEELQLEYQKILAKNLNYLLYMKSTDECLKEVLNLLNFKDAKISKFYLVKEHKLDINEKPVFYYKNKVDKDGNVVLDENGEPVKEYDYERMYDIYFQKVSLDEPNVQLALSDESNRVEYETLVSNDPFWIDDDELKQTIFHSDYNSVTTKYIGINITFKLTEMLFELVYVFHMLEDKDNDTKLITLNLDTLTSSHVSLFNATVFLLGLSCKQNGFAGNLAYTPSKVSCVYGFNFKKLAELRKSINEEYKKNPTLFTDIEKATLEKLLGKSDITKVSDINTIFMNIKKLHSFICRKMNTASSIENFHYYKSLYQTLMMQDIMRDMFQLPNGEIASTYKEYLKYYNNALYEILENTEIDDIPSTMTYVINKISIYCDDLKYINMLNSDDSTLTDVMKKFINRFKSYTTDLASVAMTYLLNSKYTNMLFMTDETRIQRTLQFKDSLNLRYGDRVQKDKTLFVKDKLKLRDGIARVYYSDPEE